MQLTRNRVGPDVWASWPPEARAAIEELEAVVGATRTTLRVVFEELHQKADIYTGHQEDIARTAFRAVVEESRPLKPIVCEKEPEISQESLSAAYAKVIEFVENKERGSRQVSLPRSPTTVTGREL